MTPAQHHRDIDARRWAQRTYAAAYDRLATDAQSQLGQGKPVTSAITRQAAYIAARAFEAEVRDPEPAEGPWCDCEMCVKYVWRTA